LASDLVAVESAWFNSPEYTKADSAINSALPLTLKPSVAVSGYAYGDIMTESWFVSKIPASIKSDVSSYVSAIESVHYHYATTTSAAVQTARVTTTSSRSQATQTGSSTSNTPGSGSSGAGALAAPVTVAAAMGVLGAVVVALL
jgi:hypothetical protein